ncbi:hypothetical protein [Deinococcus aquaedulcis]|uniref:hypothetical protein n=1 Tax=Deinococcus aquaedulcis TaxID=2840455 RepID=UPI001C83449A|nr:hypothetical protein [Deinococcus aquaedulcis]
MCQSLTPLVIHAPRRKVLRCSCGALHVVWESLNLSLHDEEFLDLQALTADPHDRLLGHWQTHHTAQGVGLWYGPMGTTLRPDDWQALRTLLQATTVLTQPPHRPLYALN